MNLREIYDLIDGVAPFRLSREYCDKFGAYDNSGILVDCGREITGALFSLDCSAKAVEEAKKRKCGLLVTHHPAIYAPLKTLTESNPVTACVAAGISVVSAHLNLDCAAGGIDDSLCEALGAVGDAVRMHALSSGGYGSVFAVRPASLKEFSDGAKAKLRTERAVVYGTAPVKKVASFCGAGMDEESIGFALKNGADTFVSSDAKHHLIAEAVERGLNVVIFTHYAAENYGFQKFYRKIKEKRLLVRAEYFTDERLL